MISKNIRINHLVGGILFGCMFPLGGFILEVAMNGFEFSFSGLMEIHSTTSVHFIIDFAPLVLGAMAYMIGVSKERYIYLIETQEEIIVNKTKDLTAMLKQTKKDALEKKTLLKEIHHRVKNNLHVVSSLLYLEGRKVDRNEITVFDQCRAKILSMAMVHEHLYLTENLMEINFKEYVISLTEVLSENYALDKKVEFVFDIHDKIMNVDAMMPLGLVLNEMITNSFKHAFSGCEKCQIFISLATTPLGDILRYADNGTGFSLDILIGRSKGLGLELVKKLLTQIEATISVEEWDGNMAFSIQLSK